MVEVELLIVSFTIAILLPAIQDIIFCSEGKELLLLAGETEINEDTTFPGRDNTIKTLALNPNLCIGLHGFKKEAKCFLQVLLPDLPWEKCAPNIQPMNFVDAIAEEQEGPLLDIGGSDCCNKIKMILTDFGPDTKVFPIIGSKENGAFDLRYAEYQNGKHEILQSGLVYGDAPGFKPSGRFSSTCEIVHEIITPANLAGRPVQSLLLEVVESVADHSISCNKNITFRRLSRGFVKEGREIVAE